jgi:flagellar secretion chaperone FliS
MKGNDYQRTEIETADRGKIILLIYDHCLKWCKVAKDAIRSNNIERRTTAIFKVQDGLTELQCALDFDKGGDIAKNLNRLYDFYSRHLSEANLRNKEKNVEDVERMMSGLRDAWKIAIENVRRTGTVNMRMGQKSYISMVG